jgi:hypothetical protein
MTNAQFSDPTIVSRLRDKQGYELWLLEFLKENSPFKNPEIEEDVINTDGRIVANIVISDRFSDERAHEIIHSLLPLIFTTTYKLIDSIFEWILEEHKAAKIIKSVPWQYEKKIKLIRKLQRSNSLILPKLFIDEPNLLICIFSLYENLKGFRNSIVHDFAFTIQDNSLEITYDSQKIGVSAKELFAFSHASVLVSKLLQGLPVNPKILRDIQSHLDIVQTLHGCPKFGFTKPSGIRFTQYAERTVNTATHADEWKVNAYPAWDFIKTRFPGGQVEDFELRIWGKRGDGSLVAWLIPSESLEGLIFLTISENDFRWDKFKIHANKEELEPPMPKNVLAHKLALENKLQCSNCAGHRISFLGYNSGREEG